MHSRRREIFTFADTKLAVAEPMPTAKTAEEAGEWKCTLTGYPLIWNVLSSDRGGYVVRLMPYSATFAPRVLALWNHDNRDVVGSTANGTLRIVPNEYGVKVEIDLPDTTAGRDLAELVGDGYVTGMSFGMTDTPMGDRVTENGMTILNARKYTVDEVTITAVPAFAETTIAIKADDAAATFAVRRRRQALQMQRMTFQSCRLPGL